MTHAKDHEGALRREQDLLMNSSVFSSCIEGGGGGMATQGWTGTFVLGWRYGSERARRGWPGLKWVQSLRNCLNYNGARLAIAT